MELVSTGNSGCRSRLTRSVALTGWIHTFETEMGLLGIQSTPAFVRAPERNGCAERFIRTLKENLLWIRTFDTVEELRLALLASPNTYNTTWLIQRLGYRTPGQIRQQLSAVAIAV